MDPLYSNIGLILSSSYNACKLQDVKGRTIMPEFIK